MFLLFLIVLGTVSVKAQVRIGGNTAPNSAAVLDLNATDAATGTKGLALPRVSLASNTAQITTGVANLTGMMVYNTNATLGVGIYFWNGSNWIIISGDGIVGNELTDTIAGGGLNKTGAGTAASPYLVGIKTSGVTTSMIANNSVTLAKLQTSPADSGLFLIATGKGVVATTTVNTNDTTTRTVSLLSLQPTVTWTKVVDTTILVRYSVGHTQAINITGLLGSEFCHIILDTDGTLVGTNANQLMLYNPFRMTSNAYKRLRCYRPSA